jgi:hypothetical protein
LAGGLPPASIAGAGAGACAGAAGAAGAVGADVLSDMITCLLLRLLPRQGRRATARHRAAMVLGDAVHDMLIKPAQRLGPWIGLEGGRAVVE